jgi:branched-chain amino acid transport system permease protein
VIRDRYVISVLIFMNIAAIFAMSWDIVGGYSGQADFGHSAFFGISGYVTAYLAGGRARGLIAEFRLPPLLSLLIGPLAGGLLAGFVGILCARKKGPYTALITLMFPLLLERFVSIYSPILGAEEGLTGVQPITLDFTINYQISVLLLITAAIILYRIGNSRLGLRFEAIREDEDACEAVGIDVVRHKVLAFVIGGVFGGMAGSFQALYMMYVGPDIFSMAYSANAVWYSIIGGTATIIGPIIGAYLVQFVLQIFLEVPEWHLLLFNLAVILIVLIGREGVYKNLQKFGIYRVLRDRLSRLVD